MADPLLRRVICCPIAQGPRQTLEFRVFEVLVCDAVSGRVVLGGIKHQGLARGRVDITPCVGGIIAALLRTSMFMLTVFLITNSFLVISVAITLSEKFFGEARFLVGFRAPYNYLCKPRTN